MILKRFYDEKLAQASYLVGCPGAGEAAVIDPSRDIQQYLDAAASEAVNITAVTETHIHADYVSGSRELASATGAKLYLSDEGDADWKYGFAESDGATLVKHGDAIRIGAVRLDVLRTPGHTPEHISFLITDESASSAPLGVFSGDFVFVGDVGRPDLLENAAGIKGTMEPGARNLYRSLLQFKRLPHHLLIWPAHGSGSACGKSLGGVPVSSLGYESESNWAFRAEDEESFVREVLSGQPEPPRYFAEMKRMNKEGPPILGGFKTPARKQGHTLDGFMGGAAVIVDIRDSALHAEGFIPGTLHIPMNKGFTNWAGWFIPYRTDIVLIAQDEDQVREAVRDLATIGLDRVVAWYGPDVIENFAGDLDTLEVIPFSEALKRELTIVDVRGRSEWDEGHVPGALHIPLGYLPERAAEIPKDKPVAVHCRSGGRSPIGATILRNLGFGAVADIHDGYKGYSALTAAGLVS
jgi:hydroxyacylglutathione hydrolase